MDDLYRRWRAFQAGERRAPSEPPAPSPRPRRFVRRLPLPGAQSLPEGWRLLDLETSGLRGSFAFLAGVARPDAGGLLLVQWLLGDLPGEPAFLQAVLAELEGAAFLVTYNGKSFDWPLLRDRAQLTGLAALWPAIPHRDLLYEARAIWGGRGGLGRLEEDLLALPARQGDPGGAEMPHLYRAYLAGDAGALDLVLAHNAADLAALGALAVRCRALDAGRWQGEAPAALLGLAGWRWRRGDRPGAGAALDAWREATHGDCGRGEALRAAELYRRLRREEEAASLWRRAAAGPFGSLAAATALAIHLEHRRRDYGGALAVVEAALQRPWQGPQRRAALLARRDRLQRRLARARRIGA